MRLFSQTASRLRASTRRPQRATLTVEVLEKRELLSAATALRVPASAVQTGAKVALAASQPIAAKAPVATQVAAAGVTAATPAQASALRTQLDGLGLNDLRFLSELTATEELIKALSLAPTVSPSQTSESASSNPGSTDATLTGLLQQMQNVFADNPSAADVVGATGAQGTTGLPGSYPGKATVASLNDALTKALGDLGITAPQIGTSSAATDASLLAQLSPNQGQSGTGSGTSLTPTWWPSGGNLADFQNAAQAQAGQTGDFDGWVGCMANMIGAGAGAGAAAGSLVGQAKGGASGARDGASTGALWGTVSSVVSGAVVCTIKEFQNATPSSGTGSTSSSPTPAAPNSGISAAGGSADVKVGQSLSSWSTSADVKIELNPSNYGKTSDQGTKSMPNPDASGSTPARGSSPVSVWQYIASVQSQVTLPSDAGHHQVTEADIQKLLSAMIVSIVSKVNPNPEAPPRSSGSDTTTGAPHLPQGGGAVDPILDGTTGGVGGNNGGGTLRGPKPSVGPGVPPAPKG